MSIRRFMPLLLASALLTSGCYTVTMSVDSQQPVLLNQSKERRGYFREEARVNYLFWGLVNTNPHVVDDLLRARKGRAIKSMNISSEMDMMGIVLNTVTLGIFTNRVVRVEGHQD